MTDELLETVEKEREIVDVLGGRTSVRHFDLVDLLRRAAATVDSSSHPDVRLDLPPTAQVCARPEIERGLQELLENALEHGSTTVTVTVEQSESTTVVEIRDDGPGIPDTETAAIEEADIDALSHGSGMGLWLVSYIVSESGGTLEFDTGSTGTTVCVTLPRT
jgi:signal transduction histidine kinase